MSYHLVLDTSPTMWMSSNGRTPFDDAALFISNLLDNIMKLHQLPDVYLYRGNWQYDKVTTTNKDSLIEELKINNVPLERVRPLSLILENLEGQVTAGSTVILVTDALAFTGDLLKRPHFKIHFVAVGNAISMDPFQLEELEDIAKNSGILPGSQPVFRLYNFDNTQSLAETVFKDAVKPRAYRIALGSLNAHVNVYPPIEELEGRIEVVGFLKTWNMLNCPVKSRHLVYLADNAELLETVTELEKRVERLKEASAEDREDSPEPMDADEKVGMKRKKKGKERKERKQKLAKTQKALDEAQANLENELNFLWHITEALELENSVALCYFSQTGMFAALSTNKEKTASPLPMLCMLFKNEDRPAWMPDLTKLDFRVFLEADNGVDLREPEKNVSTPSYDPSASSQCWITQHGINSDIQKLIRFLKKMPERSAQFYQTANVIRKHVLTTGMFKLLPEFGRIIREEVKSMNAICQKHGEYVAQIYETPVKVESVSDIVALP